MKINLKKQKVPLKIRQLKYFDNRGYFQEIFLNRNLNLKVKFTAVAKSKKNVIRGLHFQKINQQTKLVHVIEGKILDVVINLKKNSKYFGKVSKFLLNEGDILFVPKYVVLLACLLNDIKIPPLLSFVPKNEVILPSELYAMKPPPFPVDRVPKVVLGLPS